MSLPRYPKYKDSGVEWLGEVPRDWNVIDLKRLTKKIGSGITPRGGSGVYTEKGVLFLRSQNIYDDGLRLEEVVFISSDMDEEMSNTRVRAGDILLNVTGASLGRTCLVPDDFSAANVNQHVCIIRLRIKGIRSFVAYAMKSRAVKCQIELAQTGAAREGLNFEQVGHLKLVIPPLEEDANTIAAFLDRETAKIDDLIAEQQRLIELLKEKRQAVISHAVTKGLNPDAPMKDSGIEWIGCVPRHWRVNYLARLAEPGTAVTYGIVQAGPDIENGVPYIRTSDMSGAYLPEDGYLRTSAEIDAAYSRSKVRTGDIVIAIRATIGKALMVPPYLDGANLTQGTAKFSPSRQCDVRFMLYFLNNVASIGFDYVAKGATFREITLQMLRKAPVCSPPLDEQVEIAAFLDSQCAKIDSLVEDARNATEILQERRTALISAAVTGKIDVRQAVTEVVA